MICIVFGIINISYSQNYSQPIQFYNSVIEKGTTIALAYYNRGIINNELGDKEKALQDYSQAIELKADYPDAYNNRGNIRKTFGDKEGACLDLSKAGELGYMEAYDMIKEHCK